MIKSICFQEKWIRRKGQELRIDPILIERVIYAFELLSLLIKCNIGFVFKGGTSLMLILPEFGRLSLDLNIVAKEEKRNLAIAFNEIIEKSIFKRFEYISNLKEVYRSYLIT